MEGEQPADGASGPVSGQLDNTLTAIPVPSLTMQIIAYWGRKGKPLSLHRAGDGGDFQTSRPWFYMKKQKKIDKPLAIGDRLWYTHLYFRDFPGKTVNLRPQGPERNE